MEDKVNKCGDYLKNCMNELICLNFNLSLVLYDINSPSDIKG